ncbi:sugar phosphate nucleotidyltransferase [Shouchella sp. 1P09AA]|uniref:sugar phosphate nucleotidyltransferase n=1 Tax=Bacillaceae TaxID=186817 RepID=UPI000C0791E2|nr:sugar phosphate nucleotidyltransferase [Bacillus sp. Marseille-P3800]
MKVLLLCGGKGTRMGAITEEIPKPLIPIENEPMVSHIMRIYQRFGYNDFVLLLGHKGEKIKEYFMNYNWRHSSFQLNMKEDDVYLLDEKEDWNMTFLDTGSDNMTGSRVKQAQSLVGNERFMLTYGDGLSDINLEEALAFHENQGTIATVTGVTKRSQFGVLQTDQDNLVTSFTEKEVSNELISGGFFIFEPEIFDYMTDNPNLVLEEDVLPQLAQKGELSVYRHHGFWKAADTKKDIQELEKMFKQNHDVNVV